MYLSGLNFNAELYKQMHVMNKNEINNIVSCLLFVLLWSEPAQSRYDPRRHW